MKSACIIILLLLACNSIIAQQKIACVNAEKLLELMPERSNADSILKRMQDSLAAEYDKLEQKVNKIASEFAGDTLCGLRFSIPDHDIAINAIRTAIINRNLVRFNGLYSVHQKLMEQKVDEMSSVLMDHLKQIIKKIAREKGYDYVLDNSNTTKLILPYGADDISDLVIAAFH